MEEIKTKNNINLTKYDACKKVEYDKNKFSSDSLLQVFIHQHLKDEKYNFSK